MMTINLLKSILAGCQGEISGPFRVGSLSRPFSWDGKSIIRLRLEDYSGYVDAFSYDPEIINFFGLCDGSKVYIEGQLRGQGGLVEVELDTLIFRDLTYEDIVRLIPQQICPKPELLPVLEGVLPHITHPSLRQFVYRVLSDDAIAFPFVSCPGSLMDEYSYPGGILLQSLKAVAEVKQLPHLSWEDYQLGLVAALFCCIGTVLTLTPQMTPAPLMAWKPVATDDEHDNLSLEVLATALRWLQEDWPEGADRLRYLLKRNASQSISRCPVADILAFGDRSFTKMDDDQEPLVS
jgi:3'-5' exoribonuclease